MTTRLEFEKDITPNFLKKPENAMVTTDNEGRTIVVLPDNTSLSFEDSNGDPYRIKDRTPDNDQERHHAVVQTLRSGHKLFTVRENTVDNQGNPGRSLSDRERQCPIVKIIYYRR